MPRKATVVAMKYERTELDASLGRIAGFVCRSSADTPYGRIVRRLQDAIDDMHADVARIELWASALKSFAEPIPDYSPSKKRVFNCARVRAPRESATGSETPSEQE